MTSVDKQYKDLVKHVLENGTRKGDRTGTGTINVVGGEMRFNLSESFPLLSIKKTNLELAFGELMWMMVDGSTSNTELSEKYGVNFWRHWANEQGELPNIYGKQATRREGDRRIVKVETRTKTFMPYEYEPYIVNNDEEIMKNNEGNSFVITKTYSENHKSLCDITFLDTGCRRYGVRLDSAKIGAVKDLLKPTVYGVGFIEEKGLKKDNEKLYSIWQSMLERCYNKNHPQYGNYGGREVFVQGRWHSFKNFVNDVKKLPNWHNKKNIWDAYSLDKDYYNSNCYSVDTCIWLNNAEQAIYRNRNKPFVVVLPNGEQKIYLERKSCWEDLGVPKSTIEKLLYNKINRDKSKYKDIEANFIKMDDSSVYRYKLPVNQVNDLIHDLKNNNESRRMIIDNWNPWDLDVSALPSCHAFVQFFVMDGKLSCKMYQRSVDVMLGLPYNIAFYSLFTVMLAHTIGFELGEFIHSSGDTHIYNNLVDMAKEVLSREEQEEPVLLIKRKIDNIEDFTIEDLELVGYTPLTHIKGNVAI